MILLIPAQIKNPRLIVMYRGINAAMSFPALGSSVFSSFVGSGYVHTESNSRRLRRRQWSKQKPVR
jgi:hypothetical protein